MNGFRISEVAERTGFSPATLRYYEDIGIIPAPGRTDAGYRLYDDRALGRLALVARAKQLGLSLDEVGDLAKLWDGNDCGPVQQQMATFVADKLAETQARVADLTALADQLQNVADRLTDEPNVGPCDERCACNAEPAASVPISLGVKSRRSDVPIACTLGAEDLPARLSDWDSVVGRAVKREAVDGGLRLRFPPEPGLAAELAGLAQAEQTCCDFFDFVVGVGARDIILEVRAPVDAEPIVAGLFGVAS